MTENTILLVDDEEDIRDVLSISLSDFGYDVITAENGEEALDIFKEVNPPLVITDIKMPGMDGIELLQKIKYENPEAHVIMITGHGDMQLAIKSLKDDASDFITKPISVDALEISLRRVNEKMIIRQQLKDYTANLEALLFEKSTKLAEVEELIGKDPAREDVQATQQKLQRIFDELPSYVTIQDRNFKYTALNSRFKQDFGDAVGLPCYEVCKQRIEPCPDCPVVKTFEDGKSYHAELKYTAPSGRQYQVLSWTASIRDAADKITHVMVISTDISQVLDFQDHLASLGLMVGSISHDIKGLLTGMDGGMYMLDSGLIKENKAQIKEGLEVVKSMANRIKRIVLDVLFYAKERDLIKEQIGVISFAGDVAKVFKPKLRDQNIEFIQDFNPLAQTFEVDAGHVSSALINILENAVEACMEDPAPKAHKIVFAAKQDDANTIFSIRDNGIGMDRATREHIFNLFYSKKGKKGTGLGLFIAQSIISQHGGVIEVESTPGQGTEVTIIIPKIQHAADDKDNGIPTAPPDIGWINRKF